MQPILLYLWFTGCVLGSMYIAHEIAAMYYPEPAR